MRRIDPKTAAIAVLGLLVIVLVVVIFARGGDSGQDKLTDELTSNEVVAADPEERCSGSETYDRIKRELFRRAGELRGRDQDVLARLAGFAVLRAEAPIVRGYDQSVGSATCSAYVTLDLPPGVAVAGGRRSLTAEIGYTVQAAADDAGGAVTLTSAESIVAPLATLTRVGAPAEGEQPVDPLAPQPEEPIGEDPTVPADDPAAPATPPVTASPSFDCDDARTQGEFAVCSDPGLAALDRSMAAQFRRAVAAATPAQRNLLNSTRDRFLAYRDGCRTRGCIAEAYNGRMREIADIMAGRWRP